MQGNVKDIAASVLQKQQQRWRRPTFLEAFCGNSTTVNNKLILCSTSFQEPTKLDINCCWSGLVYLIISVSTLHCFLSKTTWWEEYIRNCAWTGYVTLVFGTGILTGKKQEMFESLNWFQGVTFTFTGKYLHLKTVQGNKHFPFFPLARIPVPFNPKRTNIQKLPMWYQNCLSSSLSSFILVSRWLHLWFWHFFLSFGFLQCSDSPHQQYAIDFNWFNLGFVVSRFNLGFMVSRLVTFNLG